MISDIANMTDAELDELLPEDSKPRKSQADKLVELTENVELFHQDVDEPFASIRLEDHTETWAVRSTGFRQLLSRQFWIRYKKVPSSQSLQDALNVVAGRAIHDGKPMSLHTRVAVHNGNLYLDLADSSWRAVEITPNGWTIIKDPPVKFIRRRGMLPLPVPEAGGYLDELLPFVNVASDDSFALIKAFLVSTLRPNLPYAFLVLTGEQGSGKTSQSIKLKSIVDPSKAFVRALPRELRDLAIAATNGWVLAFDNVSTIPTWVSDALCSLSTGGGFSTRELYSDSDEKIFQYQRPVILNGIGDIVTRPDLLDRCIVLQLPVIREDRRRQESDLNRQFEKARPRILGALLDAAVTALKNEPFNTLKTFPRMADFAAWAAAAEPSHTDKAIFLRAYADNRGSVDAVALEASIIGSPVMQMMETTDVWDGTFGELLEKLNGVASDSIKKSKSWPTSPRALSAELRRIAPNLRRGGIELSFKQKSKGTVVTVERQRKTPPQPPQQPHRSRMNDLGEHPNGSPNGDSSPSPSVQPQVSRSVHGTNGNAGDNGGGFPAESVEVIEI